MKTNVTSIQSAIKVHDSSSLSLNNMVKREEIKTDRRVKRRKIRKWLEQQALTSNGLSTI